MKNLHVLVKVIVFGVASPCVLSAFSSGSAFTTPSNHRVAATPCSTTRAPGIQPNAGVGDVGGTKAQCQSDADCMGDTNGRCSEVAVSNFNAGIICTYDECVKDSDCVAKAVCVCGG